MPGTKAEPFLVETRWTLEHAADRLRPLLLDPLAIVRWWSAVFLHVEEIGTCKPGEQGYALRCFTKGLLPHSFQFIATIAEVDDDRLIIVTHGDFDGRGTIELQPRGDTTDVTVRWAVNVQQPYIRPVLKLLKPIFIWNHRWAMRQGRHGIERLLRDEIAPSGHAATPTFPHNLKWFRAPARWRI